MEQRQYKEMYNEIKISDSKMDEIEMAMESCVVTKRRRSLKKTVVFAVAATLVLSFGIMASAQITELVEDMKEYFVKSRKIDYAVDDKIQGEIEENGTIVSDKLAQDYIANEITANTKSILVMVDGRVIEYPVDITPFIMENGEISMGAFKEYLLDSNLLAQSQVNSGLPSASGMWIEEVDDGKIVVTILSDSDPRNRVGWYYVTDDDGKRYLMVPDTAQFDDDVLLANIGSHSRGIPIPELEEEEVVYYNFKYKEKRYAVALWWYIDEQLGTFNDGRLYWTEVIELEDETAEE